MTAAHWFDLDRFYAECERVLQPGGVIALGANDVIPELSTLKSPVWSDPKENREKLEKLQNLVDAFDAALDWSPRIQLYKDQYRNLPLPKGFEIRRNEGCTQVTRQ